MVDVFKNVDKFILVINRYGEDLYREIDVIIMIMKFDFEEMNFNYLIFFGKYEVEIISMIFEIIKSIGCLKKLLDLKDICFVFVYKFWNIEFRKLFLKIKVILFSFISYIINRE